MSQKKRTTEQVSFDKVTNRLRILRNETKLKNVNYIDISQKVISRIYDGVHTYGSDDLAAQLSAQVGRNSEYTKLASRTATNNQKEHSVIF